MSQPPDKPEIGLEQMLRDWGADEAIGSAQTPAAPDVSPAAETAAVSRAEEAALLEETPRARPARGGAGRFVPWSLAAAAILAAGLYAVYANTRTRCLNRQLQQTQKLLDETRTAAGRQDDELRALTARVAALTDQSRTAVAKLVVNEAALTQATDALAQMDESLKQRTARLLETQRELKTARADSSGLLAQNERQMQALVQDLDRRTEAVAARKADLDRQLAQAQQWIEQGRGESARAKALETRNARLFEAAQQAFLAARAGETVGLAARQLASKRSNLIARARAVRLVAADQNTQRLVDQLEVVLTRLDMVDPTQPEAVQSFQGLMVSTKVIEQLNAALAADIRNPAVRTWLFEVKMVLA